VNANAFIPHALVTGKGFGLTLPRDISILGLQSIRIGYLKCDSPSVSLNVSANEEVAPCAGLFLKGDVHRYDLVSEA